MSVGWVDVGFVIESNLKVNVAPDDKVDPDEKLRVTVTVWEDFVQVNEVLRNNVPTHAIDEGKVIWDGKTTTSLKPADKFVGELMLIDKLLLAPLTSEVDESETDWSWLTEVIVTVIPDNSWSIKTDEESWVTTVNVEVGLREIGFWIPSISNEIVPPDENAEVWNPLLTWIVVDVAVHENVFWRPVDAKTLLKFRSMSFS